MKLDYIIGKVIKGVDQLKTSLVYQITIMVLKLILKFVVIFSLINSIQCVCQGSQAIIDAISTELNKRTDGLERHVNAILMCVGKFLIEIIVVQ